jgi:hypothetical protein
MPTVLILDDDLGFCVWLGRALNEAGIRTVPACRCDEALEIGADPGYKVDLVILNPEIEGCSQLLEQLKGTKVLAIDRAGDLTVDGTIRRPRGKSLPAPDRYVKAVRELLSLGPVC